MKTIDPSLPRKCLRNPGFTPTPKKAPLCKAGMKWKVEIFPQENSVLQNGVWGFTFIELLITIIVIAILTGLSIPQFKRNLAHFELENFTKDIYSLCIYLQTISISQIKTHCLNFDEEKNGFLAISCSEGGECERLEGRFGKTYKAPRGVSLKVTPTERTKICFYPDGSIDNITINFLDKYEHPLSLIIQGVTGGIKIK